MPTASASAFTEHGPPLSLPRMRTRDGLASICIRSAIGSGRRWFDFGTSNERQGRFLNEGLYEFKSNFGGGGVAHEFYTLNLRREFDEH